MIRRILFKGFLGAALMVLAGQAVYAQVPVKTPVPSDSRANARPVTLDALPEYVPEDSLAYPRTSAGESLLMMPSAGTETPLMLSAGTLTKFPEFKLPEFGLAQWKTDYSSLMAPQNVTGSFLFPFMAGGMIPYGGYGAILNQASYRLSDRMIVGGNSFGVNSIMSAPLPNRGTTQFDRYGASMFMQYKVTGNFKIETRVSVSGSPYQP